MRVDDWYLAVNVGSGEVVHTAVDALMAFLPGVQVRGLSSYVVLFCAVLYLHCTSYVR